MYQILATIVFFKVAVTQAAVRVSGGNVTVAQGDTAVLPCSLTGTTESVVQVTWQRKTRLIKLNANFYTILYENGPEYFNGKDERFHFVGNISVNNGSLQLSNVTLSDEGIYTCIYTLYPSGNYKTEVPLNVLVPPNVSVEYSSPFEAREEAVFGSCVAASSRPPAEVGWHLENLAHSLKITTNSTENADGTTTTVSTLSGIPTRDLHNRSVQCVITGPSSPRRTLRLFRLQISFPPSEVNINETIKNSFECSSEANPQADITWSSVDQPFPDSAVQVNGAELKIIKTADLTGLFVCKATNKYGMIQSRLYLRLSSQGSSAAGWIMFSLLLCAVLAGAIWYFRPDKKFLPWVTARERPGAPNINAEEQRQEQEHLNPEAGRERTQESETMA